MSNARRFYSSMGNPLAGKGLNLLVTLTILRRLTTTLSAHTADTTAKRVTPRRKTRAARAKHAKLLFFIVKYSHS